MRLSLATGQVAGAVVQALIPMIGGECEAHQVQLLKCLWIPPTQSSSASIYRDLHYIVGTYTSHGHCIAKRSLGDCEPGHVNSSDNGGLRVCFHGPNRHRNIGMPADEYHGQFHASIGELGVKIEPILAGKHDVDNKTFGWQRTSTVLEFLGNFSFVFRRLSPPGLIHARQSKKPRRLFSRWPLGRYRLPGRSTSAFGAIISAAVIA
jgi:hypothetical protein